jgi:hypothetical protein
VVLGARGGARLDRWWAALDWLLGGDAVAEAGLPNDDGWNLEQLEAPRWVELGTT